VSGKPGLAHSDPVSSASHERTTDGLIQPRLKPRYSARTPHKKRCADNNMAHTWRHRFILPYTHKPIPAHHQRIFPDLLTPFRSPSPPAEAHKIHAAEVPFARGFHIDSAPGNGSAACRFEGSSPSLPEQNPQRIRGASSVPDTITRANSEYRDSGNITARGATPRSKLVADMSAKARRATAAASIEGRIHVSRRVNSRSESILAAPIIRHGARAPGTVFCGSSGD